MCKCRYPKLNGTVILVKNLRRCLYQLLLELLLLLQSLFALVRVVRFSLVYLMKEEEEEKEF